MQDKEFRRMVVRRWGMGLIASDLYEDVVRIHKMYVLLPESCYKTATKEHERL